MYEEIINLIKSKKYDIDDKTLTYLTNYFYVSSIKGVIPEKIELETLIDSTLSKVVKIEFYDEESWICKKYGKDIKGMYDADSKTIFVRKNLPTDLREITVYHEIHHAVQTNSKNNAIGINQVGYIGALIMEAQTQYFAETIYETIHKVKFEDREISSENLRMLSGDTVVSKLHNYEMYDCMLTKLAIALDVDKNFFVSINYLVNNEEGLNILRKKYEEAKEKYNLPYTFEFMLINLDYIYVVDVKSYANNPDKDTILSGKETEGLYEIWPNKGYKLSLGMEKNCIDAFDIYFFNSLVQNGGDYLAFSKYIIDSEKRELIQNALAKTNVGSRKQ